jgi:hypothetical protein
LGTFDAAAAIEPRSILKTFFETGDVPTQEQFANLIDSFVHQTDDGLTILGIVYTADGAYNPATKKYVDDSVSALDRFAPTTGPGAFIPPLAPEFAGSSGFLGLQLENSLGETLYGYFQLSMDPLSVDPPGIHVDYFVFESTPGQSLVVTSVPEPATAGLLTVGVAGVAWLVRRRR